MPLLRPPLEPPGPPLAAIRATRQSKTASITALGRPGTFLAAFGRLPEDSPLVYLP